jgi:uncharacterized protein YlzI (FlbEa/FlbD family)
MNITLTTDEGQTTFYAITAIQKTPDINRTFIYSEGHKFIAHISFEELWEKIKRIKDEVAAR